MTLQEDEIGIFYLPVIVCDSAIKEARFPVLSYLYYISF